MCARCVEGTIARAAHGMALSWLGEPEVGLPLHGGWVSQQSAGIQHSYAGSALGTSLCVSVHSSFSDNF